MIIHIVRKGDTLWSIARTYGVSVGRLAADNGVTDFRNLPVGQALIVLLPSETYAVRAGDTPESVAAAAGITVYELMQYNPSLVLTGYLRAGETLALRFSGPKLGTLTVNGYAYPNIDRTVLTRALPYLTYLTVFGYGFTEEGELTGPNDEPLIRLAYRFGASPVMLLSSITGDGGFSSEKASLLFNSASLQDRVLENAASTMVRKGYVGLDADFEYVKASDAAAYAAFLERASEKLGAYGFFVNADLAPKTSGTQPGLLYEGHDYRAIGRAADSALLMTYEWGYTYSPPMAVAPLNQVERVVRYAVTEIPPEKLLLGVPNYGYDWTLPYVKGESRAVSIGCRYAVETAARRGAEIRWDETAQAPYFTYYRDGRAHEVWFEDVRSIEKKLALTGRYGLSGVGYWTVMRPFEQNWAYLSARYSIRKRA